MGTPFADFVRSRREALGISVARFSELVGRSPSTVRGWERGRSQPGDPKTVSAIAAVLDVEEDELTGLISGDMTLEAPQPEVEPAQVPEPEPAAAASFFAPRAVSPLEQRSDSRPWLPLPPRRVVVDRADRGIRYQARAVATVVLVLVLFLVFRWAMAEFGAALTDLRVSVFGP